MNGTSIQRLWLRLPSDGRKDFFLISIGNDSPMLFGHVGVALGVDALSTWGDKDGSRAALHGPPFNRTSRPPQLFIRWMLLPCARIHFYKWVPQVHDPWNARNTVEKIANPEGSGNRICRPNGLWPIFVNKAQSCRHATHKPSGPSIRQSDPAKVAALNGKMAACIQAECSMHYHPHRDVLQKISSDVGIRTRMHTQNNRVPIMFRKMLGEIQCAQHSTTAAGGWIMVSDHQNTSLDSHLAIVTSNGSWSLTLPE